MPQTALAPPIWTFSGNRHTYNITNSLLKIFHKTSIKIYLNIKTTKNKILSTKISEACAETQFFTEQFFVEKPPSCPKRCFRKLKIHFLWFVVFAWLCSLARHSLSTHVAPGYKNVTLGKVKGWCCPIGLSSQCFHNIGQVQKITRSPSL